MRNTYSVRVKFVNGQHWSFITVTDDAQRFIRTLTRIEHVAYAAARKIRLEGV